MDYSFNKVFADLYKETESIMITIAPAQDKEVDLAEISIRALSPTSFIIDDVVFAIYGVMYRNDKTVSIDEFKDLMNSEREECTIELVAQTIYGPLSITASLGNYEFANTYEKGLDDVSLDVVGRYHCTVKRKG